MLVAEWLVVRLSASAQKQGSRAAAQQSESPESAIRQQGENFSFADRQLPVTRVWRALRENPGLRRAAGATDRQCRVKIRVETFKNFEVSDDVGLG